MPGYSFFPFLFHWIHSERFSSAIQYFCSARGSDACRWKSPCCGANRGNVSQTACVNICIWEYKAEFSLQHQAHSHSKRTQEKCFLVRRKDAKIFMENISYSAMFSKRKENLEMSAVCLAARKFMLWSHPQEQFPIASHLCWGFREEQPTSATAGGWDVLCCPGRALSAPVCDGSFCAFVSHLVFESSP